MFHPQFVALSLVFGPVWVKSVRQMFQPDVSNPRERYTEGILYPFRAHRSVSTGEPHE
jgi:hypothetical protein